MELISSDSVPLVDGRGDRICIVPREASCKGKWGNLRLRLSCSLSGRQDLNLRPLAPKASALAGLRHAPIK